MEAEIRGAMINQGLQGWWEPLEVGGGLEGFSHRASRRNKPANTLTSHLWPPKLGDKAFPLF